MRGGGDCCFAPGIAASARWIWCSGASPTAQLAGLSAVELGEFETWLDIPDQQIFAWVSGQQEAPAAIDTPLFRALREFRGEGSD